MLIYPSPYKNIQGCDFMKIKIRSDSPIPLSLCENDIEKSVLQNIALLLSTKKGTVPMYREFGIPMAYINKPFSVAEAIFTAEISEALEMFEPRATLIEVEIFQDKDNLGKFITSVEVEI